MAVEAGTLFEVGFKLEVNGQFLRNYIHYTNLGGIVGVDPPDTSIDIAQEIVGGAGDTHISALLPCLSEDVTLVETSVQAVWPTRYRKVVVPFTGVTGAVAAPCRAQNVQASISKFGLLANRANRGGNRIGGLADTGYEDGNIAAGLANDLLVVASTWYTEIEVVTGGAPVLFQPVILNRVNAGTEEEPDWQIDGWTQVFSFRVEPNIRTQRTRTKGKGE